MRLPSKIKIRFKAITQLGFPQVFHYSIYRLGINLGLFRQLTPAESQIKTTRSYDLEPNWFLPGIEKEKNLELDKETINQIIREADEICSGKVRLFGGDPVKLDLEPKLPLVHWTELERVQHKEDMDIKFIWEPARFNWVIRLGQAYQVSGNEKYPKAFWKYFSQFTKENPVNKGPNWLSAQEVALRLIHIVAALHFLRASPSFNKKRTRLFCSSAAAHANRIIPTTSYAMAQNNNHILSEAAGLYTAGIFLKDHPDAKKWRQKGKALFCNTLQKQIGENGEYIQHSTNYHRMMLMLAIWMEILLRSQSLFYEEITRDKLAKSVSWLAVHMDQTSGSAANLGHNDGSNILQFTAAEYEDFRPVLQAASTVFKGKPGMRPGNWDDLCLWLSINPDEQENGLHHAKSSAQFPRIGDIHDWAYLRAANYASRPAHADQLHVDIWHKGMNILIDAGTYLYNVSPPWQNALTSTRIHNTISIDNKEQMTRAGRFLWLDWAQAEVVEKTELSATALHTGYKWIGVIHKRKLDWKDDSGWLITDYLQEARDEYREHLIKLHWLAPDYPPLIEKNLVKLNAPFGQMHIHFSILNTEFSPKISIIRAGETIFGSITDENLGWYSPTYGLKTPAISILYHLTARVPLQIVTEIKILDI